MNDQTPTPSIILTAEQWQAFLSSLYERGDKLDLREEGGVYHPRKEKVDAYVFSGHAEALRSEEVDGDVWGTLEDIEETASTEEEAWQKIVAFYLGRGCVLMEVEPEEPEDAGDAADQWLISEPLARRLGLL
ncbi:hypothetical protein E7T06_11855 [Deinococcus sp. Arct2-2]|uniref:hypothetical protein n=1 Tax=Deinococcus sp. Arct2-2 TaxID=2568653 RepID=UPI0010A5549A|nr:hypothetical protein [Deinococcus sp. Arct2-2]THF69487.1 hypothetical protein E7T06_11855 [Deinococcus sp. Arct2-2]